MNYPGEQDIDVVEALVPSAAATRCPLLSILTPAVPSRIQQLDWLCAKIGRQIGDLAVEHLILIDNKRRTVGEKRDALLRVARGDYVAYVDDDDDIAENYVEEILNVICYHHGTTDVITFLQKATVTTDAGSESAIVEFKLGNPNEPFVGQPVESPIPAGGAIAWQAQSFSPPETEPVKLPIVKRNAWHICAWRRELAIGSAFPPINYGEDWQFAAPLCAIAETEIHIPKILHFYRHNSKTTQAPAAGVTLVNDEFHKATGR